MYTTAVGDYIPFDQNFTFNSVTTEVSFQITIMDDAQPEETESFGVGVRPLNDATIRVSLPEDDVDITILDDDEEETLRGAFDTIVNGYGCLLSYTMMHR